MYKRLAGSGVRQSATDDDSITLCAVNGSSPNTGIAISVNMNRCIWTKQYFICMTVTSR
jgi:hypothetical protein